ncbi:DUF4340 domain-containing protein [Thermodesulfobacteriota bacterium]
MRIKKELVLLIIIIILLSLYLALRSRDRTHYSLPELPEISRNEISKIEIARQDSSIFLQKNGDMWEIIPQEWPVEDYIVSNMLEVMEELTFTTLVSESKSYERYGLAEDEKLTVRAWAGDTLKLEFEIGKKVPTSQHTFVKLPNNHRVYHAQDEFKWKFDQTIDKLRVKTVLSFEEDKIQEISITKEEKSNTFIRQQISVEDDSGKEEIDDKETSEKKTIWVNTEGEKWDKEKMADLLNTLSELNCEKYIDEGQKEDFKNPICDVLVKGEKQYSLSIFASEEKDGSGYPGVSSENPYPFLLSEDEAKKIMTIPDKMSETTDEKTD